MTENRRLLLVDDTPAIHEDYRKILGGRVDSSELDELIANVFEEEARETTTRFELTSAMQGQEALQLVEANQPTQTPFAVAFVDMRMPPGWDGLETIERIWRVDANLQVVICTAYSDYSWDEIISRLDGAGKLLILKKPFDPIEVRQLANTLCRKWELERAARIENEELSELSKRLAEMNAGLERSVAERTASLQMVLDSTGEGIFTVDLQGRVLSERSRMVETWLGDLSDTPCVWDYLCPNDKAQSEEFKLAFEQMTEDVFPFEVAAGQAPKRIERYGQTFDLRYREMRNGNVLDRVLVVVRDVSAQVEAENAARGVVEFHTILGNLFEDSRAFCTSIRELEQLFEEIKTCNDRTVSRRLVHTLKGNASVLGFRAFAKAVHDLETFMEGITQTPPLKKVDELEALWNEQMVQLKPFLESCDDDLVQVRKEDLDRLIDQIEHRADHVDLLSFASEWKLQPLRVPLKRLEKQAERLANQLQKKLRVCIDDGGLSMSEECFAEFWPTMVHLMRNAVDHGIETPAERLATNKSEHGVLLLEAGVANGWLELRIIDDGKGIDWEKVRSQAVKRGIMVDTKERLSDALFADGFSTKEQAAELSGRGVGLSTVREAAEKLGGGISVFSETGRGTTFVIRLPWQKPEIGALKEMKPPTSKLP
ncbi:MAG: ATP-binding protein [Planctomycetota bacterium]